MAIEDQIRYRLIPQNAKIKLKEETNIEQLLQNLVKDIQNNSESSKRPIALTKFLQQIYKLKNYFVMSSYIRLPDYEEIHQQAFQDTILVISQKIDSYELGRPILPWIRGIFRNKFFDSLKKNQSNKVRILSLDNLNYNLPDRSNDSVNQNNIEDFIRRDPDNIFRNTTIRDRPEITFQKLLLSILIDDQKWETVASELGVKMSTVSTFYQRNMKKYRAYFEKYLM